MKNRMYKIILMGVMIAFSSAIFGQGDVGTLRGAVKDKTSGEVFTVRIRQDS